MKKILAIISACLLLILTSCNFSNITLKYDDSRYTAGNRELSGDVNTISIDWNAGKIDIVYGDVFKIEETLKEELEDARLVHSFIENGNLDIKPSASGSYKWEYQKELTVTVPKGTVLDMLKIDATSGEYNSEVKTSKYDINYTSGDFNFKADRVKELKLNSTSGDFDLECNYIEKIDCNFTSGSITVKTADFEKVNADFTSGDFKLDLTTNVDFGYDVNGRKKMVIDSNRFIKGDHTSGNIKVFVNGEQKVKL